MQITNAYIKGINIDNFRTLKKTKVEFVQGLNIIIGKNGSGKSNLLEFIYNYATKNFVNYFRFRRPVNSFSIHYTIQDYENNITQLFYKFKRIKNSEGSIFQTDNIPYELFVSQETNQEKILNNKKITLGTLSLLRQSRTDQSLNDIVTFSKYFNKNFVRFQYPENAPWIDTPSSFTIDITGKEILFEDSSFDYSLFSDLEIGIEINILKSFTTRNFRKKINSKEFHIDCFSKILKESSINEILKKFSPITSIRINPNINIYQKENTIIVENLTIDFLVNKDWIPWSYLSDGTKRIFYLISESISLKNGVLFVEEPELGIHPQQLHKIMDFLKQESQSKQVIISTHSPIVLDILNNDELDRINIATYSGNKTKFTKLTPTQIEKAKKYMENVGELSYYWLHSDLEK